MLAQTGWDELIEGTLNLEVDESIVQNLGQLTPAIREPGDTVKYPPRYSHIPITRGVYLYFNALLTQGDKAEQVLIRSAETPLKRRIEAFAPVQLREALSLSDGDEVTCLIQQ